jgi:small conductance mechanosensitive channel
MITPILGQSNPAGEKVVETISRGQEMLHAAYQWLAEGGVKFALGLVAAILVYIVGSWIAKILRSLTINLLGKRGMDHTFAGYLGNILHGALMVLVIITALGQLGIPTAQFAALVAAAGLAIGLALQGNLANFASGFLLVFFRPFKRGDYLAAGGAEGTVEEIGLFTTTMTTLDNKKVVIPNSAITGGNITNFSTNPKRLVVIPCTVAATNAPEKVRASLLRAPAGNSDLLSDPAPVAVISLLGENKYTMDLRAWCPADKYWPAFFSLNEAAKKALDEDGISGPLPAMRIVQS